MRPGSTDASARLARRTADDTVPAGWKGSARGVPQTATGRGSATVLPAPTATFAGYIVADLADRHALPRTVGATSTTRTHRSGRTTSTGRTAPRCTYTARARIPAREAGM